MTRGFLAVSAAFLMAAIMLSPAMAYTICSSAAPSYTIGSGTPHQYSIGTIGLEAYSIGSGSPEQYSAGASGLEAYSIGSGSPYQYSASTGGIQTYTFGLGTPHQYSIGSGALQTYSIGMGTPAASTGSCPVVAPAVKAEPEEVPEVNVTEPEEVPEVNVTEPEEVPEVNVTEPEVAEEPVLLNIVETASGAGNLNTLVTAVEAAGLTDVLASEGPFTVFAPTDDAFALVGDLDLNDTDALTTILNRHVAFGAYMAADVANMTSITTLEGSDLTIEVGDEGVLVNGARIVQTDIVCSNGVVHIIEAVLMPSEGAEEPPAELPPVEVPSAPEEPPADLPTPAEA
ncbi:MAG: Fasciclin domain protein [Methanosaeta sp. PtaU1.Bin055]|nr:MAG: Fasciclin domain protein [Methanosaeta sp. PtaU1.Bin055]